MASVPDNADILSYNWTAAGLTIIDGQGTNAVTYEATSVGNQLLCVEVTTACGNDGPLCTEVDVLAVPDPQIDPVPATCSFEFDLSVDISPGNTASWSQIIGPPGVTISDAQSPSITVTVSQPGTYTFIFYESNGACSTELQIVVDVLDELTYSDPFFECDNIPEYSVSFDVTSGTPPYEVNGVPIAGITFFSAPIPSGDPYSFVVTDALGCSVTIEGAHDCPCITDAGSMSDDMLTACVSSGDQVVAFSNGDFTLDSDDTGTYILHDNPGGTLGNIIDESIDGVFSFVPGITTGQVYYISFVAGNNLGGTVDLNDPCVDIAAGQPVIFYDDPDANIEMLGPDCDLTFMLTGTLTDGVTDIAWSQLSGPGVSQFIPSNDIPTTVNVSQGGSYVYSLELANAACSSTVEVMANVPELVQIASSTEECDGNTSYILVFTVIGGAQPYSANIPGNFSGDVFTSDPIPSGVEYSVIVTDANGCNSNELVGSRLCECTTSAGTMPLNTVELCGLDEMVGTISSGNFELDSNDIIAYYLHSLAGNTLGTVFDSNATGIFGFVDGMIPSTLYYISLVVGDSLNGFIDPSDPCFDVAPGTPVIWYPIPVADAGPDLVTCDDTIRLSAMPADGFWTIFEAPAGSQRFLSSANDPMALFNIDLPGTYGLFWTTANGICEDLDTVYVTKNDKPQIFNQDIDCSPDLLTYTISFEVIGSGPFTVNGEPTDADYTSDILTVDSMVTFTLVDAAGCQTTINVGPVLCTCATDIDSIALDSLLLCSDESFDPALLATDAYLDPEDTLAFVLHDGSSVPFGTILHISYGDPISFTSPLQPNTRYYLNAVAGNWSGTEIDFSDPCLVLSDPVVIEWQETDTVRLPGVISGCIGDIIRIGIPPVSRYPVELELVNTIQDTTSYLISGILDSIEVQVTQETEFYTIAAVSGQCARASDDTMYIEGQFPQDVVITTDVLICNNIDFGATLYLPDLLSGMANPTGEWTANGLLIQNDTLIADGAAPGGYQVIFDTRGYEDPCPGMEYVATVIVEDCNCLPVNLPGNIATCNGDPEYDISAIAPLGINGTWSLLNPNNLTDPPLLNGTILDINDRSAGEYILEFTLTDDVPPDCDTIFEVSFLLEGQASAGMQVEFPVYCRDDSMEVRLFDLLEGATTGGSWVLGGDTIGEIFAPATLPPGEYVIDYVHPAGQLCPAVSSQVFVDIAVVPDFSLVLENPTCRDSLGGSILIITRDQGDGPYRYFINDSVVIGNSNRGLMAGTYDVIVENASGCQSRQSDIILSPGELPEVDLGPDITVNAGEEFLLTATWNLPPNAIADVTWLSSNGIESMGNSLQILLATDKTEIYSVIVVDTAGCSATDDIIVQVEPSRDVYIPNVFNPESDNPANRSFGLLANGAVETIDFFAIYDRWGDLVYSAEGVIPGSEEALWDGRFNGSFVNPGVFVYRIDFKINGRLEQLVGDVTVIR